MNRKPYVHSALRQNVVQFANLMPSTGFTTSTPAGRWQTKCTGTEDLNEPIARLAPRLGIDFHPQQPADPAWRAERVLAELQRRALEGVKEDGEPERQRRCLLILDDIDNPALLSQTQFRVLPRVKWLDVVMTSQFGPKDLPDLAPDAFLAVDRLTDEEALRLIERQQKTGHFRVPAERDRAQQVVVALGGFTLAIEAAAIYIAQFPESGCATLLEEIECEGLKGREDATARTAKSLYLHDERRLTITLCPILEALKPDERLTLDLAPSCRPTP